MKMDRIERILSGKNLETYRERCKRHPWYRQASAIRLDRGDKVRAIVDAGGDPEVLFSDALIITVEDEIYFARATLRQPDVLWFLEDFVERTRKDPDADPHPDFVEITSSFQSWYFYKKGYPHVRNIMNGARAVLLNYLRKQIDRIDGPEAYAIAEKFRLKS